MAKYFLLVTIMIFLIRCTEPNEKDIEIIRNQYGTTYRIFQGDREIVNISLDSIGNLASVSNPVDSYTQVISYHEGTSYVMGKALQDSQKVQQGIAYFFNPKNENLHSTYFYSDGKKTKEGFSFHDGMNAVNQYMLFDSVGTLIFRKTYDVNGNGIVTEGLPATQ